MKTNTYSLKVQIEKFDSKAGMHYLAVPSEIYAIYKGPKPARLVCRAGKDISWKAGLMSMGNGTGYIMLGKALLKKHGWTKGKVLEITITEDTDEDVFEKPEELVEVLATDKTASQLFAQLTPGKQRSLIVYISNARSSQLRIDRALLVASQLVRTNGKGSLQDLTRRK